MTDLCFPVSVSLRVFGVFRGYLVRNNHGIHGKHERAKRE